MTAEFAVALPSVVLVLGCCLSGMAVAGQQVRVQDAAALAARSLARGADPEPLVARLLRGAGVTRGTDGDLVCATVTAPATVVGLLPLSLTARSCARGGGL